jgi:lipid II:glycine glycyltransferase (peptidoglycan interpeptide bridge formation enzyme)
MIFELIKLDRDAWNEVISLFDDASIYQTWSLGMIRYGKDNICHAIVRDKNEIIAACQYAIIKTPFGLKIADIRWGPLWRRKTRPADEKALWFILKCLRDELVYKKRYFVRLTPRIETNAVNDIELCLKSIRFSKNRYSKPYRTLVLDLTPSLEGIRNNLNRKWRNHLNKAERSGLKIVQGTSDELFEEFMRLQQEMLARKNFSPGVDYGEFQKIQKDLPEPLKMQILTASDNDETINVVIVSTIGDTGIYLLGASADKGLGKDGSYLLLWRSVEWMKMNGLRSFDLGGIDPQGNPGVYGFKLGIAGRSSRDICLIGQYDCAPNIWSRVLIKMIPLFRRYKPKRRKPTSI